MVETLVSEPTLAPPDPLSAYLREVGPLRCLTRPEEKSLLERIRRGERGARDELVSAHLKLVVSLCREYRGRGLPFSDLIAEGNLGLLRAARNPGLVRGRFAEYAEWWIRAGVARALEDQARFRAGPGDPRTDDRGIR